MTVFHGSYKKKLKKTKDFSRTLAIAVHLRFKFKISA